MALGRKTKKAASVFVQRKRRSLTQVTDDLRTQAVRQAEMRSSESEEQRLSRRSDIASRMASLRSRESDHQRKKRRIDNASRTATQRSQESDDQREVRRIDNASRMATQRSQESDHQRQVRRIENATRMATQRSQESDEAHTERQLLHRNMRLNETTDERQRRLQSQQRYNQNYNEKLRQFELSIFNFADITCSVCKKMCYKTQTTSIDVYLPAVVNIVPQELKTASSRIVTCNRCAGILRRGRTPTQAYWNSMFLDDIPNEIASLTDVEKRLLCRIIPFVKMIKLGGRFGQYGFQGQAVLFGQDLEEVAEQLPLRMSSAGLIIVCEELDSVRRQRQFSVNVQRLYSALNWLRLNNPLYRNVTIDCSNITFDIADVCHVTQNLPNGEQTPIDAPSIRPGYTDIGNGRKILRGSFNQDHPKFSDESRGRQCTAMAATAIAASKIMALSSWDVNIIDAVLIAGDRLYMQSINTRNIPHADELNQQYLRVQELETRIEAFSCVCSLNIEDEIQTINGHLNHDNIEDGFPNLKNGIIQFFQSHDAGIVTCNDISVSIFKENNTFFLFDSHSRGAKGRVAQNGTSCVIQFPTVDTLHDLLKAVIPKGNRYLNQYTLTGIGVDVHRSIDNQARSTPSSSMTVTATEVELDDDHPGDESNLVHSPEVHTEAVFSTSVLRMVDEPIPSVCAVLENTSENIPLHNLRRKTAPPLQMTTERRAEELGFFYLFPKGRNGLQENRQHPITPLDYCQARVMSADNRFQRNDYLFYALSVMEFFRARQNVGVVLRMRQGDNRPDGLVENIHLNMRNLRGSNAYWQRASSDLLAMVRNLGPPTWFVTLSCNDLNWPDILKALLIATGRGNEDSQNLSFEDKKRLVEENPVALSRHFMVRVNAIIKHLKSDDSILGGKLEDYWYRIEFQNRGSPHLHMLCWIQNAPSFNTPEGIVLIDNIVSCSLNTGDPELDQLVQEVQVHRHSETCYKNREDRSCRFNFPRNVSETTVVLGPEECIRNKGRFCVLKRTLAEVNVNNYNPHLLKLWKGNQDIQPCGNVTAAAYYITKYTSKHEPQDVGQAVRDAVSNVRRNNGDIGRQLFAVSMAILNHRRVSACEAAFRLCHLKLRDSSRKTVFLNTCRKEERYRMLRLDSNNVHTNIFDRYEQRPTHLENISLAEFSVQYEPMSNLNVEDDEGDQEVYEQNCPEVPQQRIRLLNGTYMKRRRRNAILRTKYYAQTADREGYFYSYLVAHVPFRQEETLLDGYETAEEAFLAKRTQLRPLQPGSNIDEFQAIQTELQQVVAQVLALELNDVALSADITTGEDQAGAAAIFEGYDPVIADVDVDIEFHDLSEPGDQEISDHEFANIISNMNVEQSKLFETITKRIKNELRNTDIEDTLKLFITGGAGSGKTFVLKAIVEQIKRCYKPTVDRLLNPCFVEVTALTGVAARLVNGRTLHSALALGIEKGSATTYRQLTGQRLEDARRKWRNIRWLIVDEISMVSYEMLRCIHLRLQELKNNQLLFGGVNVLVFGDLMQLPPVKGSYCFKQPVQFQGEPHLWRYFGFCELRRNMRQRNDMDFVDLLNNLRVGELTIEQYELLLERTRVPLEGSFADGEAVRIYPTIKLVDNYNQIMLRKLSNSTKMYIINARDESREPSTYGQKPPDAAIPSDTNNTGGLVSALKIGIGTRVMLRTNIQVSVGLVNGSMGIVRGFQWEGLRRDQLEDGEIPKKIYVEFDDANIGRNFKDDNGWIGISPISVTYQGNKGYGKIERVMIPLILSWAVTVHKLQGTTVDKAVVYLGTKTFAKGQAYVALSRVRSLSGLAICELNQRKLFNNPHNSIALDELERLRKV